MSIIDLGPTYHFYDGMPERRSTLRLQPDLDQSARMASERFGQVFAFPAHVGGDLTSSVRRAGPGKVQRKSRRLRPCGRLKRGRSPRRLIDPAHAPAGGRMTTFNEPLTVGE